MTKPTRDHLAGLRLAFERWNDGGPSVQYAALLEDLIEEAKAAPEGEAVAWICPEYFTAFNRTGFIVSTHKIAHGLIPLYTAPLSHDAELIELLETVKEGLDEYWIATKLKGINIVARIDAKLTELRDQPND